MAIKELNKDNLNDVSGAGVKQNLPEGTKYVCQCNCCGAQWYLDEKGDPESVKGCPTCGRWLEFPDGSGVTPGKECVHYFELK